MQALPGVLPATPDFDFLRPYCFSQHNLGLSVTTDRPRAPSSLTFLSLGRWTALMQAAYQWEGSPKIAGEYIEELVRRGARPSPRLWASTEICDQVAVAPNRRASSPQLGPALSRLCLPLPAALLYPPPQSVPRAKRPGGIFA